MQISRSALYVKELQDNLKFTKSQQLNSPLSKYDSRRVHRFYLKKKKLLCSVGIRYFICMGEKNSGWNSEECRYFNLIRVLVIYHFLLSFMV